MIPTVRRIQCELGAYDRYHMDADITVEEMSHSLVSMYSICCTVFLRQPSGFEMPRSLASAGLQEKSPAIGLCESV